MTGTLTPLARTLDQELVALVRGASLECPVCGEFVLHLRGAHGLAIACPECRSMFVEGSAVFAGEELPQLDLPTFVERS